MADKVRLIDAELLTVNIAQIAKKCARSDAQKALIGRILFMIEHMPTIEAITREEFIRKAKELITAFVGSGEKTEENRILFALVFGNLELRLYGSRDGDSE